MSADQKHTPEPWRETINCCDDYTSHPILIYSGAQYVAQIAHDQNEGDETEANARRIVACVNACAGYSTDALESGISVVRTAQKNMEARALAEAQRDELAAALRGFVDSTLYGAAHDARRAHEFRPLFDAARSALAKVQS